MPAIISVFDPENKFNNNGTKFIKNSTIENKVKLLIMKKNLKYLYLNNYNDFLLSF